MAKEINTLWAIWLGPSLTSIRRKARVPCYLTRSRHSLLLVWTRRIPQEQKTIMTRSGTRRWNPHGYEFYKIAEIIIQLQKESRSNERKAPRCMKNKQ
jgi:hypothetical protein